GLTAGVKCTVCGEVLEAQKVVAAKGHTEEEIPAKAPTCTETGLTAGVKCTVCGEVLEAQKVVAAKGHTEEEIPAKAPTYTQTGLTAGVKCSVCGKILKAQEVVPVLEPEYYSVTYRDHKNAKIPDEFWSYRKDVGLELPVIECEGYEFIGWTYKKQVRVYKTEADIPADLELIDHIEQGSDEGNVTLYAHWMLINYEIIYEDAPVTNNPATYTVEDGIVLKAPSFTGLKFNKWTDKDGNEVTEIKKGSTGDITLYATWIYEENMTVQSESKELVSVFFDEETNRYYFVYELGFIDNVVLKVVESRDKGDGNELKWTESSTVTVDKSVADTAANTVTESFSQSSEVTEVKGWVESKSDTTSSSVTGGLEIGGEKSPIKFKIESSIENSSSSGSSESKEYGSSSSQSSGTDISDSISSTVAFSEGGSTTIGTEQTIPGYMPKGTYRNVCVGKLYVYAVISYDIESKNYFVDTFSILDKEIRGKILYTPASYDDISITYSEGLDFNLREEDEKDVYGIIEHIDSRYYVEYDNNGGEGSMYISAFEANKNQTLATNSFSRIGYEFRGWSFEPDGDVLYLDKAEVNNLASAKETITLYAVWEPIPYKVTWDIKVGCTISVNRTTSPAGGKLGDIKSGDTIYYGDVLEITYTSAEGYHISSHGETEITVETANITSTQIYAVTANNTYTISYFPNGAPGKTVTSSHTYGVNKALSPNTFTRSEHVFLGWSTDPKAKAPTYTDTQPVINLTSVNGGTYELYAIWLKTEATVGWYSREIEIKSNIYSDTFYPAMDRDTLIANGYTSLRLTISVDGKEGMSFIWFDDHPYIEIYSYKDYKICHFDLEGFGNGWSTKSKTAIINLREVDADGKFYIKYGNNKTSDPWNLGTVEIKIEAVK
ncbi:MAG: InlB B-repeat-containing protein, partial [Clostridia bacterium]|nr:InlB B-repeat-containing protein [Clostridia bacterium]